MRIELLIPCLIGLSFLTGIIRAARKKEWLAVSIALLFLPFFVFAVCSIFLGGSSFHDAARDYGLYQTGHYYLMSHGDYTEVIYAQYQFMRIMEVVGIGGFVIGFVLNLIHIRRIKED
jgi:hypothetical protein